MSKNEVIYYRAELNGEPQGLVIFFKEWFSIRESECFHWCVSSDTYNRLKCLRTGETYWDCVKRRGYKIRRMDKKASRYAQPSKEKALTSLRIRKRHQLIHAKREAAFSRAFLDASPFPVCANNVINIENTEDLVNEHYRFDY